MEYIQVGSKSHKNAALGLLIGSTVTFAIMYSPQPLISLYSKQYNIPPETASLSISLTTIALAVSLLFVTVFANSCTRKYFMSGSLIALSCLSILTSFVQSFYLFLILRFLEGIAVAGFPSTAMAYLNEEFSPKDIGRVMGLYISGNAIGGLSGRIIVGVFTDLINWHTAFLIQGIVSLLGSLWFLKYLPESRNFIKQKFSVGQWVSGVKKTLLNKSLILMYAAGFLSMGTYIIILNYIGYPLTRAPYNLSQTVFGFLFVVNLFGIFSSTLFGRLADRYPRRRIVGLAIIITISGVLLTLDQHLIVKVIGVAAVAFGFMAVHSVISGWIGFLTSKEYKGQASSFYLFFFYTGSSLLGWSGGIFLTRFGWNGLVCYTCFLLTSAFLIIFRPWSLIYEKSLRFKAYECK